MEYGIYKLCYVYLFDRELVYLYSVEFFAIDLKIEQYSSDGICKYWNCDGGWGDVTIKAGNSVFLFILMFK